MNGILVEYLGCTSLEIQKHNSGFCVAHSVKLCYIINFLISIIIQSGNLIFQGNTGSCLIDILHNRDSASVNLRVQIAPADLGKCGIDVHICIIDCSSGIVRFQITGQILCRRFIHAFLIKACDKLNILGCIHIGSGNNAGIVVSRSFICFQRDLQGILLVHQKVTADLYSRGQIAVQLVQTFDLAVFQYLAAVGSTDLIGKTCNLRIIGIHHQGQFLRSIQRGYTVSGKIRLHGLRITVHPVSIVSVKINHYFRENRIIHIRAVIRGLAVQQK